MTRLILLLLSLASPLALAQWCGESKTIEHQFDPSIFTEVELKALAGELEVTAGASDEIHFWGKVCTDTIAHLDMIDLDILQSEQKLTLAVIIPYHQDAFDPDYASMDIELRLPATLALKLRDSSGDMLIDGVYVTSIEDSSGDMKVIDGLAELSVRDSSGRIQIHSHHNDVTISDSSGDIELKGIQGNVTIPGDSSGDIDIDDVLGTLRIERDGSGGIGIDTVGGDVIIGLDGSGDIDIESVGGKVSIGSDGSGTISVSDVDGDLEVLNKGSGDIRTHSITGNVDTPR
jgi:hypothetical protein